MRLFILFAVAFSLAAQCPPGYRGTVSQKTIGPSIGDRVPVGIAVRSVRCAADGVAMPADASILPSQIYQPGRRIWPWQWFRRKGVRPR